MECCATSSSGIPLYNTLYNVTSAKLKFFFFWPLTYLFLFMRLGINKVL